MKTILVVDDESYFAKSLEPEFDSKKYKIITAEDGEVGLKMIKEQSPDAVLLDIKMPKMDGIEVLKNMDTKKIPVIITSNESSRDIISQGIVLGARGYIIKSDESPKTIVDSVENLFK